MVTDVKNQVERVMSGEKKKDPKDAIEWLKQHLDDLKQSSSAKQATVGAVTGYTSGFVFGKFGRTAATAVGGTVLAIHVSISSFIHNFIMSCAQSMKHV